MNNLKKKVIASAAMLLVAAVMMTGSSFAWYTISTRGDVQQIKAELKATDNLEIARCKSDYSQPDEANIGDDLNQEKWGTTVDDWGTGEFGKLDVPATVSQAGGVQTASYSETGRVGELIACAAPTSLTSGVGYYTADVDGDGQKTNKAAVVYTVWLRSNNTLDDVKATITNKDAKTGLAVRYQANNNGGTWIYPTMSGNVASFGTITADTPYLVEIIAYIDGDTVTAKDVEEGIAADIFEVSFTSDKIEHEADKSTNSNAQYTGA